MNKNKIIALDNEKQNIGIYFKLHTEYSTVA